MSSSDGPRRADEAIDWEGIEHSREFRELIARKRRFVLPATIFFLGWYAAFILLAGYAPDFMGESIYQGFTVGYLLALTQFVMVWVLTAMYLKRARTQFDPLEEAAVAHLREQQPGIAPGAPREGSGRFDRRAAADREQAQR